MCEHKRTTLTSRAEKEVPTSPVYPWQGKFQDSTKWSLELFKKASCLVTAGQRVQLVKRVDKKRREEKALPGPNRTTDHQSPLQRVTKHLVSQPECPQLWLKPTEMSTTQTTKTLHNSVG